MKTFETLSTEFSVGDHVEFVIKQYDGKTNKVSDLVISAIVQSFDNVDKTAIVLYYDIDKRKSKRTMIQFENLTLVTKNCKSFPWSDKNYIEEHEKKVVIDALRFFRNDCVANSLFNFNAVLQSGKCATEDILYNLYLQSKLK